MIKIEEIILYKLGLKLRNIFSSNCGSFQERSSILVEIKSEGISGWGEAPCLPFPFYNHEDDVTAFYLLEKHICPKVIKLQPQSTDSMSNILGDIVGNNMAKAGIELAFWDLLAKLENIPLYKKLEGIRNQIQVGVVVTEFRDPIKAAEQVSDYLEQGYKRIKLKIAPGHDLSYLQAICTKFPKINFMLDANAAYTLKDIDLFKQLDDLNLLMIEQPLAKGDFVDHAELQAQLKTIICLDESVDNYFDAKTAIKLKSCRAINIKPARVGGLAEVKLIHDAASESNIGVWCGGMLETGIGRAHNMATATLANYIYPGDISESSRYYERDIIDPEITFSSPGILTLSEKPGIGVNVLKDQIIKNASKVVVLNK